jgi:hypothetical protein
MFLVFQDFKNITVSRRILSLVSYNTYDHGEPLDIKILSITLINPSPEENCLSKSVKNSAIRVVCLSSQNHSGSRCK